MTTSRTLIAALLLMACAIVLPAPAYAQFADANGEQATAADDGSGQATLLTAEQLNALVAPVALYPDDLLAIVLPACTNPIQVVEAQRFLDKRKSDPSLQPDQ